MLEFVIAQSPDKMKGFVIGHLIAWFSMALLLSPCGSNKIASLHFVCVTIAGISVLVVLFVVFLVLSKCYTLRERNREINIQAIVEEHYERYMDQEEEYMRHIDVDSA